MFVIDLHITRSEVREVKKAFEQREIFSLDCSFVGSETNCKLFDVKAGFWPVFL